MATIFLNESLFYRNGVSGASRIVGNDTGSKAGRRVCRYSFTAPETGASSEELAFHIAGVSDGTAISVRFYIGTDPDSHTNAGLESAYTGELTLSGDWLMFTGQAEVLLLPGQTYYLWVFPGSDTFGYYAWGRTNYVSTITTSGAATTGVFGENGTLGTEHAITLSRYSDTLRNTVEVKCGTASLVIAENATSDTVKWVPPIEWAEQNPNGLTVAIEIKCTTYEGEKAIGSNTQTVLFDIPEYVVPTVTITIDDAKGYSRKYGTFVQGRSIAKVQISAIGAYGSVVKEFKIKCGDKESKDMLASFELPNAGPILAEATVTDSRGRIGKATAAAYVVAYAPPTATILDRYRSDADGNQDDNGAFATVVFKANITPLYNKNSALYAVKYRVKGRTAWSTIDVTSQTGNYAPDSAVQIVPIQLDAAYELAVSAKDDFTEIESLYRTVQVAFFLISVNRSKRSVGIGQKATEDGLCAFGIPAKFNAGVNVGGKTLTFAYNESIGGYVLMETEG